MRYILSFLLFLLVTTTYSQNAFITTWKTDNPGVSEDNQINIPTFPGETYNYTVDWGDGIIESNFTGDATHTYSFPGVYQVSIEGSFPRIFFNNQDDREKILSIDQWGTIQWSSMENAFYGCSNLDMLSLDIPVLSGVTSMASMFSRCMTMEADISIGSWNTSTITNMSSAFNETFQFNSNIGAWDVGNVTNMSRMFNASFNFNQDIGNWNVSNVRAMDFMFGAAFEFNQDIGNWDVSQVENMSYMLYNLFNFNHNLTRWNVSSVTNMSGMFASCNSFNQDISTWDVSNVTNMASMFANARIFNQDLGVWNVAKVTTMAFMFNLAYDFDQDIGTWDIGKVTDMTGMFNEVSLALENYDNTLQAWSSLTDIENSVVLGGGNSQYCGGSIARKNLMENYGWTITDGGEYCPETPDEIWLEAECAIVGSNWGIVNNNKASRNAYLLSSLGVQSIPPTDVNSIVAFTFNAVQGSYNLYGRLKILTAESGGLWLRINNGEWLNWKNNPVNAQFEWYALNNEVDTDILSIPLQDGNNLIEIANHEVGMAFDKLYVVSTSRLPSGFGDISSNCEQRPFVTTWKTDIVYEGDTRITIPTISGGYNFNVDWGDGTQDIGVTNTIEHYYSTPGTYTVSITGKYPRLYPYENTDSDKLVSIDSWGDIQWLSMADAFSNCDNVDLLATDVPDLSRVTSLKSMFLACYDFIGNESISNWDVSGIKNFNNMFGFASQFNQDLTNWDVSNGTNFSSMFSDAVSFNGDITSWNMVNAQEFSWMFLNASSFNQPIGNWIINSVEFMNSMFEGATSFNQDLGSWNIQNVQGINNMFKGVVLSTENYDNLLKGWSGLPSLKTNLDFDAGVSNYCNALEARQSIIDNYGWVIRDAGISCPFITTWKTDNPGLSEDNQINIPTFSGEIYDYTVDWGDGIIESNFIGDATHTYANSGTYQVSISGVFPRIYFNNYLDAITDAQKILTVNQWGEIEWKSMESSFLGCKNLDIIATDMPDLSNVTSLTSMFAVCTSLQGNVSMNSWNLSNVNSINGMFGSAENFNIYVGDWNVSSVTDMGGMFYDALSFNQDIGNWNVANVTNMSSLFYGATNFNQNIGEWDISNVTNMNNMFDHAISFNQDIGNWDVSNVTEMSSMFTNADAFNGDISGWDVSKVQYMDGMFYGAARFNQNIGNWNVSNVIGMQAMLGYTEAFNQDISGWNVGNVITMNSLFNGAVSFDQDIGEWNVSNVENMQAIFYGATQFDQDLSKWDVSNVTNMLFMLNDSGVSIGNYDLLLNSWSQQSLQNSVQFEASNIQYCDGENARQYLTDTYGWIITDGGKVPFCNEDNDLDGVLDHLDNCLETRPNVTVNENGCEVIASDAIMVYGATPTCPGESNGSISITSALTDYNFNIAIEGPISSDYNGISLNENLEIPNLITGLYTITISIPDISHSQTYGIQINEVGTISGKRESLNTKAKTASYNVEGSYTYTVDVNGEMKTFNFMTSGINEIQLTDLAEFNAISISGESDCQGVVTDSFAFSEGVIMYPTITTGEVFVEGFDESSTVLVYDLAGRLVLSQILSEQGSNLIDLRALENGMYPTVIQSKENSKTFKIIKR